MSALPINLPPRVVRGQSLTADWCNSVREAIARLAMRKSAAGRGGGGGGGITTQACPFGQIIDTDADPPEKAIRGGRIICGDKNFNVDDQVINTDTDGVWLVQIKLTGITCATDDDNEIFLPGVTTASGTPEWDNKTWSEGTNYDDTTNPTSPSSATGDIVLPIGKLTIQDNVPKLASVACGPFTIGQCAGILNSTRE